MDLLIHACIYVTLKTLMAPNMWRIAYNNSLLVIQLKAVNIAAIHAYIRIYASYMHISISISDCKS